MSPQDCLARCQELAAKLVAQEAADAVLLRRAAAAAETPDHVANQVAFIQRSEGLDAYALVNLKAQLESAFADLRAAVIEEAAEPQLESALAKLRELAPQPQEPKRSKK